MGTECTIRISALEMRNTRFFLECVIMSALISVMNSVGTCWLKWKIVIMILAFVLVRLMAPVKLYHIVRNSISCVHYLAFTKCTQLNHHTISLFVTRIGRIPTIKNHPPVFHWHSGSHFIHINTWRHRFCIFLAHWHPGSWIFYVVCKHL